MQTLTILTGASRGMGLAMAQQLVQPGANLLCISRKRNPELQAQADAAGAVMEQWSADLADGAPVAQQLKAWLDTFDPRALASATLINNAGVLSPLLAVRDSDPSALAQPCAWVWRHRCSSARRFWVPRATGLCRARY